MDEGMKKQTKATFAVSVQCRENATWQGKVKWIETDEEQPFRSMLELVKMIDSALDKAGLSSEK